MRGWAVVGSVAVIPILGVMAAWQQTFLSATLESIPSIGSIFRSGHEAARMDGRIQAHDLLSSHFGHYGWPGQSFDYVIVGGGTAGLVMARRLSEDGSASVAVIEAGGFAEIDAGNATEVPMYLFNYFFDNGYMKNPLFDWYQYTEPQPVRAQQHLRSYFMLTYEQGLAQREMFYMQGKTLGGSTARGCMLYHRYNHRTATKPRCVNAKEPFQRIQRSIPEVGRSSWR